MSGLGHYLQNARNNIGHSIDEMSLYTDISVEHIQALENNNIDILPAKVIRRYIRQYCKVLGMDPNPIIDEFTQDKQNKVFNEIDFRNLYKNEFSNNRSQFSPPERKLSLYGRLFSRDYFPLTISVAIILVFATLGTTYYFFEDIKPLYYADFRDSNSWIEPIPALQEGPTSTEPQLGQLYYISPVKKVVITVKGINGESGIYYRESLQQDKKFIRIQTGDMISFSGLSDGHIWFHLTHPSNVEVRVNEVPLSTTAQDVSKSYRIKISPNDGEL